MHLKKFSIEDDELVRGICADIAHVRERAIARATESDLRQISASMRNIVSDFHKSWRLMKMPTPVAIINAKRLNVFDGLRFAYSADVWGDTVEAKGLNGGGFSFSPTEISGTSTTGEKTYAHIETGVLQSVEWRGAERATIDEVLEDYKFRFTDYLQSCAIYSCPIKIARERIVRYVADTRGGTHYDRGGSKKKKAEDYSILDSISLGDDMHGRDPVFLSFLSICQEITKSADVISFEEKCAAELPPPRRR